MRIINVHQAKTHLSRILDEVKDGEEIILAKGGKVEGIPLVTADLAFREFPIQTIWK